MLTEGGEAPNIGHQDGHPAQIAAQLEALWPLQNVGDDLIRQIATEGGANEFFIAFQLLPVLLFPVVPALAFNARLDARRSSTGLKGLNR